MSEAKDIYYKNLKASYRYGGMTNKITNYVTELEQKNQELIFMLESVYNLVKNDYRLPEVKRIIGEYKGIKSCDNCGNSKQHNKSNTWCRRVEVCGNLKIEWRPVGSKSKLEIIIDEAEEILKDEIERTNYQYRIDNCKQILQAIQALKEDHPEFKGE